MTSRTIPSIDFRVWSSQLGTIDSFTDDLLKRLESTTDTKSLTSGVISASTLSQGSLSTLDDENSKRLSILPETPVYMEKTLEQSCQSFECFNIVKQHEHPSTSAAAAAAAAEEKQKASLRKSTSISEKSVLRKSSAYFSHTIRRMKEPRRPSSPVVIKEKKPMPWWRKLFSRA